MSHTPPGGLGPMVAPTPSSRLPMVDVNSLGTNFELGDVFAAVANGSVNWYRSDGTFVTTLNTGLGGFTTGMAFDGADNLYVTMFSSGNVARFDNMGNFLGTFGGPYNGLPESIVFDASQDFYVGAVFGDNDVRKFNPAGTLLDQYNVQVQNVGSDWIELADDQCTLFYTSEGSNVFRYDVCTDTQLPNFATGILSTSFALRLLPDGELLVANRGNIVRLNAAGAIVQTYDATGEDNWFALNLDPDGTSFWSGSFGTGDFYKFDIATGNVLLGPIATCGSNCLFGLTVFGEITAADPGCSNIVMDDFDTTDGSEFFDLTNSSTTAPANLNSCMALTYNVFTARAAQTFDLDGVSLAPGDTYRIGNAGVPDVDLVVASGFLPEPWGFGLVDRDIAVGDHVSSFLPDVVTSLIYLNENAVYLFFHENPALDALYCGFYAGRIAGNSPEVCRISAPEPSRADAAAAFASEFLALQASLSPSAGAASATLPSAYALHSASPNPSRGAATLRYDLPEAAAVRLAVYDVLGREVAVLAGGEHEAGTYTATFDGASLPAGTYLVRLEAGAFVQTRPLTVVH